MFLFIAMEASGFSRVACRTEEMLDPCVSASLSVLDTDHSGALSHSFHCVASAKLFGLFEPQRHTVYSSSKSKVNGRVLHLI